jgi:hypothetical protein
MACFAGTGCAPPRPCRDANSAGDCLWNWAETGGRLRRLAAASVRTSRRSGKLPYMTVEDMTLLASVYFTGAIILSLLAAFRLDLRLKTVLPGNRSYFWGFFFGCICISFLPLAALSAVETVDAASRARWAAYEIHGVYTVIFALNVVCGWLIIRRQGWAWILGTLVSPVAAFPVVRDLVGPDLEYLGFLGYGIWLVNCGYGLKRWAEFQHRSSAATAAEQQPFEPQRLLTSLEAKAQSCDAPAPFLEAAMAPPGHSLALPAPAHVSTDAQRDTIQGELPLVFGPQGMQPEPHTAIGRTSKLQGVRLARRSGTPP